MTKLGPSDVTHANHVELIRGGKQFFQLLKSLIDNAQSTIYLQVYIFDDDNTGREIAHALKAAARRKVRVCMLIDAYASKNLSGSFIDDLENAGIHFRWFKSSFHNNRFYFGRRLHHKVVVVDSSESLVCGLNISNKYNDTTESTAWLDWALYTRGEVSVNLEQVCKRRIGDYSGITDKRGGEVQERCTVRICVNDWVARRTEVTKSYLRMIDHATRSVTIMSPYFMPGYLFRRSLKRAIRRGVKVQIILTGVSDIFVAKFAEKYMYDWLLRWDVELYEYQTNVLHGKLVVCDQEWVSVGSYNINNLSAYASIELNLEIKNEKFATDTEKRLAPIIANECVRITRKMHEAKTTFLKRIFRRLAYDFLRLMLLVFAFKQHG